MKLYYVPRTRASRPRWVLEELGAPYELVRLDPGKGETRSAEHLARHPLGHVPVLEDGDVRIFESAAICLYLAEKDPAKRLLPPAGTADRGMVYQWLFYAMTELEPPAAAISAENRKPEAERNRGAMDEAKGRFHRAAAVLDPLLAGREYLLGGDFTVADVIVGSILNWGKLLGGTEGLAGVEAYVARVKKRPSWKRSIAD